MHLSGLLHLNRRLIRIGSWLSVFLLSFLSLLPSRLEIRTGAPDELEHFFAYFLAAVLFSLSYPRRTLLVALVLLSMSIALEALQAFSPGRSVRLHDIGFSSAGAIIGVTTTTLVVRWISRRFRSGGAGG